MYVKRDLVTGSARDSIQVLSVEPHSKEKGKWRGCGPVLRKNYVPPRFTSSLR